MVSGPIRLLVVDDHPVVRDGVRSAMADRAGIEVVGEAASWREAVDAVLRLSVDVVLVDLHMPGGSGVQAIREVRRVRLKRNASCSRWTTMTDRCSARCGRARAGTCSRAPAATTS